MKQKEIRESKKNQLKDLFPNLTNPLTNDEM